MGGGRAGTGEDQSATPAAASQPSAPSAPSRMEPPVGAESGPFWEATRERTLLIQWCTACDKGIFFPRSFCPGCSGSGSVLEWRQASGRATVYASTTECKPTAPFADGQPYVVALVDLEEGGRMLTNVVGCPPADVHVGLAVTVTWEPLTDGRQLPLFTPDTSAQR